MNVVKLTIKHMPQVSVIVPIYNVEKYIERCVRSLFEQTLEDIEFIFVNDCTPDNSMAILEKVMKDYPERERQVKITHHLKNQGLPVARNSGMALATGEYIVHCDSDDWVERDMYEKMYRKAVDTDADIVGCDFYYEYYNNRQYYGQNFDISPENCCQNLLLNKKMLPCIWSRLVKRSLYMVHQISFFPGINMGEDFIVSLKLHTYARKIISIHEGLYHYVQYNSNSIVQQISLKQINDIENAHHEIEKFFREKNLYAKYRLEFLEHCFISKKSLLFNKKIRNYKYWKAFYPESNREIWQYSFSWWLKLSYSFAVWGFPFLTIAIKDMKSYLKSSKFCHLFQ